MGQGGLITLVNGTSYNWKRVSQHSYQMNSWNFPEVIEAGKTATVYVEWDQGLFTNEDDDAGEARYQLAGVNRTFEVQARGAGGFHLQILLTDLATSSYGKNATIPLGWAHDGYVQFVLAGDVNNGFTCNNPPVAWMQANLNTLAKRPLRHICLPGSHDAGMSKIVSGTFFASACNTITQQNSIGGQLHLGSRYFDIRPVISGGQYYTGHYGYIDALSSWQGANGQSIDEIINDVNAFTAANKELVILNLSHDLNTDVGNDSYRSFNQDEWNRLFDKLSALKNLCVVANPTTADLTKLSLETFIGGGKAAVLVIVASDGVNPGAYAEKGFYTSKNFPLYDSYSNTNDVNTMMRDQLKKMAEQRTTPDSSYFLLSWTLTQSATQASTCSTGFADSIQKLAYTANPLIYKELLPACSARTYPNILYIDFVNTSNIAALAMAVNSIAGQ